MPTVSTVKVASLTPERLWSDYVAQRRPVLIDGLPLEVQATAKWTLPYLKEKAGKCDVVVERRVTEEETFGKGSTTTMGFGTFLDEMQKENACLYLSAQNADVAADGFPELLLPPLTALSEDFPQRPALLGNLIPQQINLWMGCSVSGASSGLHHDYHDNLYLLLRGRKHFALFPPSLADRMYTQGVIEHIHENGRIVYDGQGDVLADGSDAVDVAEWENRQKTEQDGSTDESDLEAILDRCQTERDDYSPSSGDATDDAASSEEEVHHQKKRQKSQARPPKGVELPPNFSGVDLQLPRSVIEATFPRFPDRSVSLQCEVEEQQMLYLPAGWFHNVTSSGATSSLHVAVNYWCHPPDNLHLPDAFSKPYRRAFWPSLWRQRHISS